MNDPYNIQEHVDVLAGAVRDEINRAVAHQNWCFGNWLLAQHEKHKAQHNHFLAAYNELKAQPFFSPMQPGAEVQR